jgi:serine protease inhibitor ecotin
MAAQIQLYTMGGPLLAVEWDKSKATQGKQLEPRLLPGWGYASEVLQKQKWDMMF